MSKTTFDLMKEEDIKKIKELREKGKNVADYTYDESISINDARDIAAIQNHELINDNNTAIISAVKEAQKEAEAEANKTQEAEQAEATKIHTGKEPVNSTEIGEISDER